MLNTTQQIFTLFFAIFWGVAAGAQPKWKAFHYTFFFRIRQVTCRTIVAFLILNVLPILYFSIVLKLLNTESQTQSTINQLVLHGVIPAFAIFGFYRIWICIIEFCPRCFYRETVNDGQYPSDEIEPTFKKLGIPLDCTHLKNA